SRDMGVFPDHIAHRVPIEEIVIHLAGVRAKAGKAVVRSAKIEMALVSIVEKDPVGQSVVYADVEGSGDIKRIRPRPIPIVVRIPVNITRSAAVKRPGLFAQTQKSFTFLELFVRRDLFS